MMTLNELIGELTELRNRGVSPTAKVAGCECVEEKGGKVYLTFNSNGDTAETDQRRQSQAFMAPDPQSDQAQTGSAAQVPQGQTVNVTAEAEMNSKQKADGASNPGGPNPTTEPQQPEDQRKKLSSGELVHPKKVIDPEDTQFRKAMKPQ